MPTKSTDHTNKFSVLKEKLCVIIPTYNNAKTLGDVIVRVYKFCENIIVVNDGSTDNTLQVIRQTSLPIELVSYLQNQGKGYALVEGFKKALSLGWKYAITIDSDGQHYPEDIPLLIEAEYRNPNSIIIGSRNLTGKDMSKGSSFANKFSNFWFFIQTSIRLSDTQTGFRLYPLEKLKYLNMITSRYESELELLVFASWNGVKLAEVSINVYYPPQEERISHFRPYYDFARISVLNTLLCVGAILYCYPRKILLFLRSILYTLFSLIFFLIGAFILTCFAVIFLMLTRATAKKKEIYHKILHRMANFVIRHIPGTEFSMSGQFKENFKKPAVIISNHQSHLDLMCAIMLTPKLIILTKNWVWNNPFYGIIIRLADYYPITHGYEKTIEYIGGLVNQGFSVLVYPEGTRSKDCKIQRFHRGAFYIAEQLNLDIIPMIEYGPGKVLAKTAWKLDTGKIHIEIENRITPEDKSFGEDFRTRAKGFERFYKRKYQEIADRLNFGE